MGYTIEIYDTSGRRVEAYEEVPLLDVVRRGPDQADLIRGLLPKEVLELGHAFRVRALLNGAVLCDALVKLTRPCWSDTVKLILEQYVPFHEVVEFEASYGKEDVNRWVSRAYANKEVSAIAKDVINSALGPVHYTVAHTAYPDGALREYQKFLARKTDENELEAGGIARGQWVGRDRIDFSGAYAKDGDTISGIRVDGAAWPDVRLLMIDSEELELNSHALLRHPEVAGWSGAQYAASGYARKAEAAKAWLTRELVTRGIDFIELNPHKNAAGEYDDRVDQYGRYIALVFGGYTCLNAAMVEQGLADVYLWEEGAYHLSEMALKDFYSYTGCFEDSVESSETALGAFDVRGGALEVLTALCYAANGFVFSVDAEKAVRFRRAALVAHVVFFDPLLHGIRLGSESSGLCNHVLFQGNPMNYVSAESYTRGDSISEYGLRSRDFSFFSITRSDDAQRLMAGVLADLAYPEPSGSITFFRGNTDIRVGEIVEVRGDPLRRIDRELPAEWDGRFLGKLAGRVCEVRHRFTGSRVESTVYLTSPLRSVAEPLSYMVSSQESAGNLYEFRLDDATVGLDMGFHLD